jgi:hypothetical protein
MKDRDRGLIHFVAFEVLIVILVLTNKGLLDGIGVILSMFSFGALVWIAINDRQDEDEDIQDEDEI